MKSPSHRSSLITHHWFYWLALAAGLIVRLLIAPLGAHSYDFAVMTGWAEAIYAQGWLNAYLASDANYPPLTLALLGAMRWLYGWLAVGAASGPLWLILFKLPPILADTGIAWVARPQSTPNRWPDWLLWLGVVFNPALIYLSAWWGQHESVYGLFALMSVLAAIKGRPARAGFWLGLGLTVKLQAIVAAPVVLLSWTAIRRDSPLKWMGKVALGIAAPVAALSAPFVLIGQSELVAMRLIALVVGPGWLTVNALNFWWLVTGGDGNWRFNAPLALPDTSPLIFGFSARAIGLILLALWTGGVCAAWLVRRGAAPRPAMESESKRNQRSGDGPGQATLLAAALLFFGAFFFPTQSHERYSFGAVVALMGTPALSRQRSQGRAPRVSLASLLALVTLLHGVNLVWAASFSPALDGWLAGNPMIGMAVSVGFALWGLIALVGLVARRAEPQQG